MSRPFEVEARKVAESFHARYDKLYPRDGGNVEWADMPASYRQRLTRTFEQLLTLGILSPGPSVGWTLEDQ